MEINRCYGCMSELTGYPCSVCGYDPATSRSPDYALRQGSILNGKYLVGKVLGQGGFGITYVGWDLALERKVAIKEYFPSGQVSRHPSSGNTLQWYETAQSRAARQSGMDMFLKEARKMSRVDGVEQVVRVRGLFQENGTAYIVMDFIEGETLKNCLAKTGPLGWADAQKIFLPAIEAMEKVHQAGLIHRDLSPDNLMLTPEGTVKILDLGAAKDLNVNSGASSMQVAKGGFSPLEQYTQRGGSGTWTDVYAIAATMYYALTGVLPPAAVDRVEEDGLHWDLPQLQALPKTVVSALKQAMALRVKERTQTMSAFAARLQTQETPKPKPKEPKPAPAPIANPAPKPKRKFIGWIAASVLAFIIVGIGFFAVQNLAAGQAWGKNVQIADGHGESAAEQATEPVLAIATESVPEQEETAYASPAEENVVETTEAVETPEAGNEFTFQIETSENAMDVNAENLNIHVENKRNLTVTISGLSLQETYTTDLSTTAQNVVEYSWWVYLCGTETFSVSTFSCAYNPGKEKVKSLKDMQHSVWKLIEGETADESYNNHIGNAKMSHTADSITWTFSIPKNYAFDFSETRKIEVSIWDLPNDNFVTRTYVAATE